MLLVDKPAGPSSHDIVARVRATLGIRRVGHAGTLDPPATGLLVVLVGRATRLARFIALAPKRYHGTVRFGFETTTDDAEGEPTERDETWRERSQLEISRALEAVAARTTQVPPAVSAKKVDGQRAYRAARRGRPLSLVPVPITIYRAILGPKPEPAADFAIEVDCAAGTYVRAIARDLGRELGTRAHLAALRRTGIGPWSLADAAALGDDADALRSALRPMREAVAHLARVELSAQDALSITHGRKLPAGAGQGPGQPLALFSGEELVAVAAVRDGFLAPDVVLSG